MTLEANSRYANYARVHGRTLAEQLAQDKIDWPGAPMFGFVIWNRERIREYSHLNPEAFCLRHLTDHDAYDVWLAKLPVIMPDMKITPALAEPEMQVYQEYD